MCEQNKIIILIQRNILAERKWSKIVSYLLASRLQKGNMYNTDRRNKLFSTLTNFA